MRRQSTRYPLSKSSFSVWVRGPRSSAAPITYSGEIGGRILNDSHNSDFDGDGSNDLSVFRPSTGTWYSQNGAGFDAATAFRQRGGCSDVADS
ncbi:MAG: hypothetical protein IPN69_17690 [Acidobacteria bacterium]|nr:hypothetical protein [Acidobacteriota bacterium]